MVDRTNRDRFSQILRHFGAGVLTVDRFEEQAEDFEGRCEDIALSELWYRAWCSYDDFRTERMRGEWALRGEHRTEFCRMILFLQTEEEYVWPESWMLLLSIFWLPLSLIDFLTLGLTFRLINAEVDRRLRRVGDLAVWPFQCKEDFLRARATPRLLCG